ncbi:MAG: hypothetical protein LBH43_19875 [Treponema sp.]|jgi:hypothetical protein|nr:hypothetical protein [Treponema sp.]
MKKTFVIIALVFLFVSCDNGSMEEETSNPFVGTWENDVGNGLQYTFTETYVTQTTIVGETIQFKGTYAYNDTHITINTDYREPPFDNLEEYPNPFVWTYRFENDILIIGLGSFTKVSGSN